MEDNNWGEIAAKLPARLRGLVLPWHHTLQHLELKHIRCTRRVLLESGGSSGGFSFLSGLTGLTSLMLTDVSPLMRSSDLAGCASLQKLRYVRREVLDNTWSLNLSACTALRELDLYGCSLSRLDVSGCTNLEMLHCAQNQIRTLKFPAHPHLRELICESNNLRRLQLKECPALESLLCADNTTLSRLHLPDGESLMRRVSCGDTNLSSLDVSRCTALQTLKCGGPRLRKLNFLGCKALRFLECADFKLTKLDLRPHTSLRVVNLYFNTCLAELNLAGMSELKHVMCYLTPIAKLDLTGCCKLEWLNLESKTKLTLLDLSKCHAVADPHILSQIAGESAGAAGRSEGQHTMSCKCCRIESVQNADDDPDMDSGCEASHRNQRALRSLGLGYCFC